MIISTGAKPVIKNFSSDDGDEKPYDQDDQNGPFYISDDPFTRISDPVAQGGKKNGPKDTTDQLQGNKLGDFHIQDTESQGAGQT